MCGAVRYRSERKLKTHWQALFRSIAFGPLIVLLLIKLIWQPPIGVLMTKMLLATAQPAGSVDLVFLAQSTQLIVFVKHPEVSLGNIANVINADEVIQLDNVGREGGTYLTHILKHYNLTILTDQQGRMIQSGKSNPNILEQAKFRVKRVLSSPAIHGLADHTVFMQPKISWHWIAKPQMDLFDPKFNCFLDLASSILRGVHDIVTGKLPFLETNYKDKDAKPITQGSQQVYYAKELGTNWDSMSDVARATLKMTLSIDLAIQYKDLKPISTLFKTICNAYKENT
ncbi:hypothetical protein PGT21_034038 [Puccinia graminis f. sp. tritici]|uniref:Uncharacterized protein n=1 Tax=Puccinia graminis f. sp. tritici TaxID=56615 RepID=A0A5B0QPZ2_PUCGR|nr:hypothetical protein PGT21_034038 [Puccinia graminis f. sp. tritici]